MSGAYHRLCLLALSLAVTTGAALVWTGLGWPAGLAASVAAVVVALGVTVEADRPDQAERDALRDQITDLEARLARRRDPATFEDVT